MTGSVPHSHKTSKQQMLHLFWCYWPQVTFELDVKCNVKWSKKIYLLFHHSFDAKCKIKKIENYKRNV